MDRLTRQGDLRHDALRAITDALIRSNYTSLDAQARALGISRSTAWTVIKQKHKLGRLYVNTTMKILANPELPVEVRAAVEAYVGAVKASRTHGSARPRPRGACGVDSGAPTSGRRLT